MRKGNSYNDKMMLPERRVCRVCGRSALQNLFEQAQNPKNHSDNNVYSEGCLWVKDDLCSQCAEKMDMKVKKDE